MESALYDSKQVIPSKHSICWGCGQIRRQGKGWIKETLLSCIIRNVVRVKPLYAWQFMPAIAELWKLKQEISMVSNQT